MSSARQLQIYVGLALALVLSNLGLAKYTEQITAFGPLLGREAFWWALVVIVLLYVVLVEGKPLSSIGFRRVTWKTFVIGFLGAVVSGGGITLIFLYVLPVLHLDAGMSAAGNKILATPFWYRVLLVTRAAFVEEVLFRGYAIERIDELTGSRVLAGIVAWLAFMVAHMSSWGAGGLIVAGFGGLVLTALYLWRRDLPTNMAAHWITDGVGLLLPH